MLPLHQQNVVLMPSTWFWDTEEGRAVEFDLLHIKSGTAVIKQRFKNRVLKISLTDWQEQCLINKSTWKKNQN